MLELCRCPNIYGPDCIICMCVFCRENAEGSEGGNPAVRKRFKRGTLSLPEPSFRTPPTGGEIRRFERGDHTHCSKYTLANLQCFQLIGGFSE